MNSSDPKNSLTNSEAEHRKRLQAIFQRVLDTYVGVGPALADIGDARLYRDTRQRFETYLRERWGAGPRSGRRRIQIAELDDRRSMDISIPARAAVEHTPAPTPSPGELSDALANICEQARDQFRGEDVSAVEIRVTLGSRQHLTQADGEPRPSLASPAEPEPGIPLPQLRWLLTQANGTIGNVLHQVETHAADLDDDAREQLRNDLSVVDEELGTLMALLFAPADWDAEYGRLLAGEIAPFEDNTEDEEDK